MAKKSKSDISNNALRIFLQKVGEFYDEKRGYEKFVPNKKQKEELLKYFNSKCCFCESKIDIESISQDHLIPTNKKFLGLHSWGNVVPCCKKCNNDKNQTFWEDFLMTKCNSVTIFNKRKKQIDTFVKDKNYEPNLDLNKYADDLYQDVGEVAMTLINLRYKQAEDRINKIIEK